MICPRCSFDNLPGNDLCERCQLDLAPLDHPAGQDRVQASLMADRVALLRPRKPVVIDETASVADAVDVMRANKVGALLVVSRDGRQLIGIFSERDLLMRTFDHYPDGFRSRRAAEYMTQTPESVSPEDSLARALHKMDLGGYRHLPVVSDGVPVGMISVRDLVRHITRLCKERV